MTSAPDETLPDDDASGSARLARALTRGLLPGATALVALAASIVALLFTLWPRLGPDPGTHYRAQVSVFAIDRGVTFGAYLHRIAFTPERYRERRRAILGDFARSDDLGRLMRLHGQVVYVQSTVKGFKRRSVSLRWSLYDARSRRRLQGQSFGDVLAADIHLDTPADSTMQQIWVPPPPSRRPYYVRVALYDERETLLDAADSRAFRR